MNSPNMMYQYWLFDMKKLYNLKIVIDHNELAEFYELFLFYLFL